MEGGWDGSKGKLKEKGRTLERRLGYLGTMHHYFVCVTVSESLLVFFLSSFQQRKHIYLCINESTIVPVLTQTQKDMLLNQQAGLFRFPACTMQFLEAGGYFLAQVLNSELKAGELSAGLFPPCLVSVSPASDWN